MPPWPIGKFGVNAAKEATMKSVRRNGVLTAASIRPAPSSKFRKRHEAGTAAVASRRVTDPCRQRRAEPLAWHTYCAACHAHDVIRAGKDGSRARASALMPRHASSWTRIKDDGRAEAVLIALWGVRELGRAAGRAP